MKMYNHNILRTVEEILFVINVLILSLLFLKV